MANGNRVKTGECYYRNEQGDLMLAASYQYEDGDVVTEDILIEPAPIE